MLDDMHTHRMRDWSGRCKKHEEKLVGVKLSEVLARLVENKSSEEIIKRAIEIYGDITYGELINDKNKLNTVYDSFKESI